MLLQEILEIYETALVASETTFTGIFDKNHMIVGQFQGGEVGESSGPPPHSK